MVQSGRHIPWIAVGLVSGAALSYEVLLTRLLAQIHWHHLVGTIISLALLGYGASGTFLALTQRWLDRRFAAAFVLNALLAALAMVACFARAQAVPLDPQALAWEPGQVLHLASVYLLLAIPFFGAANCIGLVLWRFRDQIPRLYGIDLLGAGAGAASVVVVLVALPPIAALSVVSLLGLLGAAVGAFELRWRRLPVVVSTAGAAAALMIAGPLRLQPAEYKDLTVALNVTGAAVEHERWGPMGVVEVVRNDEVPLRRAPGLSLLATALPPEQRAVFVDGDAAGTLVRSLSAAPPAYLRDLTSALPYALLSEPRVLVIGAGAGSGVVQALAHAARRVDAVEPNPQLAALPCGPYLDFMADACGPPRVQWHALLTRAFLAGNPGPFDLVSLNAGGDVAGMNSQQEDHDLTVEAFAAYLRRLAPRGILAVDAPTRLPPRLALRLAATARAALVATGATEPARHVAAIRGWQRFTLLVSKAPLTVDQGEAVRAFAARHAFDLVWLPNMDRAEANRFQRLAAPYFHDGVASVLTNDPAPDAPEYAYRITPVTDERPYPYRFSRWGDLLDWSWGRGQGGEVGTRVDAGFAMSVATLLQAILIGAVLILLPLFLLPRRPQSAGRGWGWRVPAYFGLLGLAFLFVEIAWIQKLMLFLGHPVYATAVVLVGFLVFAGLGSQASQRREGTRHLATAVAIIVLTGGLYAAYLPALLAALADLPGWARVAVSLLAIAPLAFAMGMPFPIGLRALAADAPRLVPWAWGVNGCASVVSAVAAPLIAMEIGFSGLVVAGLVGYFTVAFLLPRRAVG